MYPTRIPAQAEAFAPRPAISAPTSDKEYYVPSGAARKERGHATGPVGWVHVDRRFLHADSRPHKANGDPITPRVVLFWLILDGYCGRDRTYCFPGIPRLAGDLGVAPRTMFEIAEEAEADGIALRVFDPDTGKLIGFILLKRADSALRDVSRNEAKVVWTPVLLAELAARNTARNLRGKPRTTCAENRALDTESLSLGTEQPESGGEKDPSERQRPEAPEPEPELPVAEDLVPELPVAEDLVPELPVAEAIAEASATAAPPRVGFVAALAAMFGTAPGRPAAACQAAPPRPRAEAPAIAPLHTTTVSPAPTPSATGSPTPASPAITPSQRQWLESRLSADERQRFAELPVKGQEYLLAPHRDRVNDDRILAGEARRMLAPKAPSAAPPAMPATTAELWERLPHGPPGWVQHAANDLVRDFNDQKFWHGFRDLAEAVWRGQIDPSIVLDSHRQAMKPGIENRGALFNHALKGHGIVWPGNDGRAP